METPSARRRYRSARSLGNFLSGMETQPGQGERPVAGRLGNFLSGMETSFANRFFLWCPHLGNFLSGMETSASLREGGVQRALETSLVEWKLGINLPLITDMPTLETSLVEWKRRSTSSSQTRTGPWKLP